jgi:hypothetical protein
MQISNRLILGVVAATLPLTAAAQSTKPTMKAIVVHQYGDPEVLKYEDVPRPAPKENRRGDAHHRGTRPRVMALVRRSPRPPGMPDAFDRALLR